MSWNGPYLAFDDEFAKSRKGPAGKLDFVEDCVLGFYVALSKAPFPK